MTEGPAGSRSSVREFRDSQAFEDVHPLALRQRDAVEMCVDHLANIPDLLVGIIGRHLTDCARFFQKSS